MPSNVFSPTLFPGVHSKDSSPSKEWARIVASGSTETLDLIWKGIEYSVSFSGNTLSSIKVKRFERLSSDGVISRPVDVWEGEVCNWDTLCDRITESFHLGIVRDVLET